MNGVAQNERGCAVSYNSLRRFIQRRGWRRRAVTMRLAESAPGEVAELDFDRLGLILVPETGRRRTVWALIVALRYSRHCFVWSTTSRKLEAALASAYRLHPPLTRGFSNTPSSVG